MSTYKSPKAILLVAGLIASTFSNTVLAEDKLRLNFGVYSSNKPSAMVKVFRPVLEELEVAMSSELDREVDIRMQIAKDYDQGISHLINGRVDISYFGPASYVEAKRMNRDISIIAVENKNNSKVSFGIIAVKDDSPINKITDLRGRSFAFGDEGSTIGRFLSQLELEQSGIRSIDLSRYEYLGRHDKVGTAVGAGAFDAGALNEKTFKKLVESGVPIRELVRFPNVAKPWIARSGLDEEVLTALRTSLLQVTNRKALAAMKIDGFLEGGDEDYSVIRRAMENNAAFFADHEDTDNSQANNNVSAAEPVRSAAALPDATNSGQPVSVSSHSVNHGNATGMSTIDGQNPMSKSITLNIELPANLFDANKFNGPDSITVNIKLPQIAQ